MVKLHLDGKLLGGLGRLGRALPQVLHVCQHPQVALPQVADLPMSQYPTICTHLS